MLHGNNLSAQGVILIRRTVSVKNVEGSATRGMLEETWLAKNVLRPQAPEFQKMVRQLEADPNWKIEPGPDPVMVDRSTGCSSTGTAEAVTARARPMVERENFILRFMMRIALL